MSCKWIAPTGDIIKTKTIREFSERFGMSVGVARQLHSGQRPRAHGFCSMAAKAKKQRKRFMTKLVYTVTGETKILGASVMHFAREHGLSLQGLSELVNRRVPIYRHWVLADTMEAIRTDSD